MYIDERQNLGENAQRIFFIHFHGNFLSFHGISQYPNPVTTHGNLQKIQSKLIPLTLNILFITLQSACIHIPSYQHEHKYPNISVSTETNKQIPDVHFPEIFEIFQVMYNTFLMINTSNTSNY